MDPRQAQFYQMAASQGMQPKNGAPPPQFQDAANQMGPDIDWSSFGGMSPSGGEARDQAITAAYDQAASRLNPMWDQREERMRTQLLNQGLDAGSEAYDNQMDDFGRQRTDAFQSALNSAIGQGTQAGESIFRQGMMSRQQALAEALRRRSLPMQELAGWQSLYGEQGKLDAANGPLGFLQDLGDIVGDIIPLFPGKKGSG